MTYYWIKERHNPQCKDPYYVAMGQMPAKDARKNYLSIYGYNVMLKYATKKKYDEALAQLEKQGKRVL